MLIEMGIIFVVISKKIVEDNNVIEVFVESIV